MLTKVCCMLHAACCLLPPAAHALHGSTESCSASTLLLLNPDMLQAVMMALHWR